MDVYPCTIVTDRYTGAYSRGQYTAWNLDACDVPADIDGDDTTCMDFWDALRDKGTYIVGLGSTPQEAYYDLKTKLAGKKPTNVECKIDIFGFDTDDWDADARSFKIEIPAHATKEDVLSSILNELDLSINGTNWNFFHVDDLQ